MCQPDYVEIDLAYEPGPLDEREAELVEASARLHVRVRSLIDEYGLSKQETIDILEAEELYWAEDKFTATQGGCQA